MLISNVSNTAQAAAPARLASDGEPAVVVATRSNVEAQPDVPAELPQVAAQPPSTEQLKNVVDGLNRAMKQNNKNLEFSVDTDTNKVLVKLVDTDTGDVIRQFPSEEALAISHAIDQIQQGLLLKQKA